GAARDGNAEPAERGGEGIAPRDPAEVLDPLLFLDPHLDPVRKLLRHHAEGASSLTGGGTFPGPPSLRPSTLLSISWGSHANLTTSDYGTAAWKPKRRCGGVQVFFTTEARRTQASVPPW